MSTSTAPAVFKSPHSHTESEPITTWRGVQLTDHSLNNSGVCEVDSVHSVTGNSAAVVLERASTRDDKAIKESAFDKYMFMYNCATEGAVFVIRQPLSYASLSCHRDCRGSRCHW